MVRSEVAERLVRGRATAGGAVTAERLSAVVIVMRHAASDPRRVPLCVRAVLA